MGKQKLDIRKLCATPRKKNTGVRKNTLSFLVKHNTNKTCEVSFAGSMDKYSLRANYPDLDSIAESQVENVYIDLVKLDQIDDAGLALLVELIARLEKNGIRFQIIYSTSQVGSKVESSGLADCLSNPRRICG